MQLNALIQVAIFLASQAVAAPLVDPADVPAAAFPAADLLKRANPSPVSCGPSSDQRAWPLESVQNSYTALTTNGNLPKPARPSAGTRAYPQPYGSGNGNAPTDPDVVTALNAIPECKLGQTGMKYFEFPLLDPVFATGPAGSQGPDRVVAISAPPGQGGTRTYTYCLAMTHRGGTSPSDPSFRPCTNAP